MSRVLLPKITIEFEPVTWGSKKDSQRRRSFYDSLVCAVRLKFRDYDFAGLARELVTNAISFHFDFFISDAYYRGLIKGKDIENLCKIPIDAVYEHIVGNIEQDWHVVRIVAQKHSSSEVSTELEIVAL